MKNPIIGIIGYSIESCMWARKAAILGEKVVYFQSGELAYPLDNIRDYIYNKDIEKLKKLEVTFPYKKFFNNTFVFIPYEQLQFVNTTNGIISFPLNKSSFESAEEWEQIEVCMRNIQLFKSDLEEANNFLNIYKNFFPKWLYDCLLKQISINKWGNIRQSKYTKAALAKEINLSYLNQSNTGHIFRPEVSYSKICEMLLDHPNIIRKNIAVKDIREFMLARHKDMQVILMDNRVDYICNYTYGYFDRVKFRADVTKDINYEEFIDNEGVVFTPTKDYFCITSEEGNVFKIYSEKITEYNYVEQSQICPTSHNEKLYEEYKKMVGLYSGKILNLDFLINTVIK
jgi:hypothetical protein